MWIGEKQDGGGGDFWNLRRNKTGVICGGDRIVLKSTWTRGFVL